MPAMTMKHTDFEQEMRSREYLHSLRLLLGAWIVLRGDGHCFSRLTENGNELWLVMTRSRIDNGNGLLVMARSRIDAVPVQSTMKWSGRSCGFRPAIRSSNQAIILGIALGTFRR